MTDSARRPSKPPSGSPAGAPAGLIDPVLVTELFASLESPPIPAALRDDSFLAGIYEHAVAAEARTLGPILEASLTPSTAPDDACWQDVPDVPGITHQVEAALPDAPGAAPGLLWTRIAADIQEQRGQRRRQAFRTHFMRRAAAAVLLGVGLFGTLDFFASDGTPDLGPTVSRLVPVFRLDPGLAFDDSLLGR
jgi:hypothetical protein